MSEEFDVIVIGSGSAGLAAAYPLAEAGKSVLVVEKDRFLGGECPNYACIPTKAILKVAKVYRALKAANKYGIELQLNDLNYPLVKKYKNQAVGKTGGHNLTGTKLSQHGIKLVKGEARFNQPDQIEVGQESYIGRQFVIATGSSLNIPPIKGLDSVNYLTSKTALELDNLPESITILGAGPVGVEFATFFASLGSDVTLLQRDRNILNREEPEISKIISESLSDLGVKVITSFESEVVSQSEQVVIKGHQANQPLTVASQLLLIATGTKPNIDGLQLEIAGVQANSRGIITDRYLKSSVANIWAAGDVSGHFLFTHTAHYEGSLVAENILGAKKEADYRIIPRAVFCEPEVASIGRTEAELTKSNRSVVIGKAEIGLLGRALTDGVDRGLVKIIADRQTGLILGASIASPCAGQMIHEIAVAMKANLNVKDLAEVIHAFPTYSEAILIAADQAAGQLSSSV